MVRQGTQTVAFTSSNPTPVSVGGPTYTPTATGGASASPVVLSLDSSSTGCALMLGIVSFTSAGTCVIDANQAGDANFLAAPQVQQTITVNPVLCSPGTYSSTGDTPCTPAPPGSYVDTVGATAATSCPVGTFSSISGSVSCTLAPPGSFVDTVGATAATNCPVGTFNPNSGSTSGAACVTVVVANPGNQSSYVNGAIVALGSSASNGILPVTWSSTGLPVGLSLDPSTGTIVGTPTTTCSCSVTLMATDAGGHAGTTSFTWNILGFGIVTTSLPGATRGVAYGPVSLQEAGAGISVGPYVTTIKWAKGTVVAPVTALPKGMKLSKTGVLSGTPAPNWSQARPRSRSK